MNIPKIARQLNCVPSVTIEMCINLKPRVQVITIVNVCNRSPYLSWFEGYA